MSRPITMREALTAYLKERYGLPGSSYTLGFMAEYTGGKVITTVVISYPGRPDITIDQAAFVNDFFNWPLP